MPIPTPFCQHLMQQMTFKVEDEANEGEVHSDPASQSVGVAVNAEQGLLDAVEMEEAGSVRVNGRRRRKHFQGTGISCELLLSHINGDPVTFHGSIMTNILFIVLVKVCLKEVACPEPDIFKRSPIYTKY